MICQVICEQLLLAVLVTHIRPDTAELVGAIEAEQGRFFSLCFVFSGVIIIHIAKFENMKVLYLSTCIQCFVHSQIVVLELCSARQLSNVPESRPCA